jgi:hypothetical protein
MQRINTIDLDKVGATASATCAVHCALMPLIVTLMPLVGLSFLSSEAMEWALLALSAFFGVTSLCLGYKNHRQGQALALLCPGLAFIVLGRIAEEHSILKIGVPLVVMGGLTVAGSHWLNHRLCRTCVLCTPKAASLNE